jgi:hypothetical protein
MVQLVAIIAACLGLTSTALAQVADLPDIPNALPAEARQPLEARRAPLETQRKSLLDEVTRHNARCVSVRADTPEARDCAVTREPLLARIKQLRIAADKLEDEIDAAVTAEAERTRIINSMNALAKRLGWSAAEQARLNAALKKLNADGDPNATGTQIRQTWGGVLARGHEAELARKAAGGDGPGFPGAGTQSFEDCTIFALANAAGLPYSVVAARATKLISEGEWRDAVARANPQKAIEQRGLMGGEVVMMAEALGQAEVVRSADFARTLKEGRRLLLNVVPQDGDTRNGHAVVLTKAFQHGGETWYEMMDSNQGPQRRHYLSAKELNTMLQETGVAFRAEPGRTPGLLR